MDALLFAKRLKEARVAQCLSLRQLAAKTQAITNTGAPTAATLCNYEKGNANPVLSSVRALAEALGVSVVWLAGGDCDMYQVTNSNVNSTNCTINNGISQDEAELLAMFRKLSIVDKSKVFLYIDGLKK